jgi:orotate phosphoribosyltransferase
VIDNEIGGCEHLVGLATAGIPLAAAAALQLGIPMCYTRKLPGIRGLDDLETRPKDYGDHSMVEGDLSDGARVVMIDDVSAQFTSKQIAHWQLTTEVRKRGLRDVSITAVVVLVDREQGATAKTAAAQLGMKLVSLVKLRSEGLELLRDVLSPREHEVISAYIADPGAFQDPRIRAELISEARDYRKNSSL